MEIIFDLDSTLLDCESLELAIALAIENESPAERKKILRQIESITNAGMAGEIPPIESLRQRFAVARPQKKHFQKVVPTLSARLLPGMVRLVRRLQQGEWGIFIVSGAPRIFVESIGRFLQIPAKNLVGCEFEFSPQLDFSKVAKDKLELLEALPAFGRESVAVGDGATDLQLWQSGLVGHFVAFAKVAARANVIAKAPHVAHNEVELEGILQELFPGGF